MHTLQMCKFSAAPEAHFKSIPKLGGGQLIDCGVVHSALLYCYSKLVLCTKLQSLADAQHGNLQDNHPQRCNLRQALNRKWYTWKCRSDSC